MSDSLDEYLIGEKLTIKCNTGYYQDGLQGKKAIKATCSCNGNWEYDPKVPDCERKTFNFCTDKSSNILQLSHAGIRQRHRNRTAKGT